MPRNSVYRAPFISLEGGEGSGKTTQAELLERRLKDVGMPVLVVREPGSTKLGEQVRRIIKAKNNNVPAADALLFMAARAQLLHEVVIPNLEDGIIVIGDRFSDSTIAYQGFGGKLDIDRIRHANELATDGVRPDLTILLNIKPEIGLARRSSADTTAGETQPRFEGLPLTFHRNVGKGYKFLAGREPNRWVEVDAVRDIPAVHEQVWRHVSEFF